MILPLGLGPFAGIDGQIGTGGQFQRALSDSMRAITAEVTDSGGASGSDTIGVVVGNPSAAHVGDLDDIGQAVHSKWEATVMINVHDQSENPLASATVTGMWSNEVMGGAVCTTDASGQCNVTVGNLDSR